MSVVQQVISDARKLASRLAEHDASVDSLIAQTQGVFKQVESMKEYCEEMNGINAATNNRPRTALIESIQQENRHIRELQRENKELRLALEEHQNIMELIMSKYRHQMAQLISTNNSNVSAVNSQQQAKISAHIERCSEMVSVMNHAAKLSEEEFVESQTIQSRLAKENRGLREMLNISFAAGSLRSVGVDVHTQTESQLENGYDEINANCLDDDDGQADDKGKLDGNGSYFDPQDELDSPNVSLSRTAILKMNSS